MKKRFLLPLLLFFLPATIIGAVYAGFVYSNKVDTKTDSNSGKIDDVKPNFKLDENNYTIYFFPSMQTAQIAFSSTDESTIIETIDKADKRDTDKTNFWGTITAPAWGYWGDVNSNEIIGNADATKKKYYPKKIETHGGPSISLEQFNTIAKPSTKGQDDNKSPLDFCGWTAVKQSCITGYKSQGDFSYFSAFDDLTKTDVLDADGTKINDKIIFLYPIFTTGKNYGEPKNSVRLQSENSVYYLSQNNDDYSFNNLVIENGQKWSLCFAGTNHLGGWYKTWPLYKNGEAPLFDADNTNSIIKDAGIYNVYVYLQRKTGRDDFSISDAKNSKFYREITGDKLPLIYIDDLDAINSSSLTNNYRVEQYVASVSRYFWMFVKVEKVYEFRLAGTEGRGFTFDTAGQLYVSHFNSANFNILKDSNGVSASTKYPSLDNSLWKMYYLDNVFMEKEKNNIFAEYINHLNNLKYKIRNTVFSILPSDESLGGITSGLQAMGGDDAALKQELDFINEFEIDENVKGNYLGTSDTSFNRIDKNGTPENYIKDPMHMPHYSDNYTKYFFASEFKYSCFCKVLIKVDFNTSGENMGEPKSIHVAVAPYYSNRNRIYVYPEKYSNGDSIDFSYYRDDSTKLIDPENDARLIKHQITYFDETLTENGYLLKEQDITVKGLGSMKLSAYLDTYVVRDHLTNKRIRVNRSYRRHMVCLQEGIASEFNK